MRLLLCAGLGAALYLPGMAPNDYSQDDSVELRVNKLTSAKTQLPKSFYFAPFCRPDPIVQQPMNLGEQLLGERIYNSAFDIRMNKPEKCRVLCQPKTFTAEDVERIKGLVAEEYSANWLIDNLPVATRSTSEHGPITYMDGFPLGFTEEGGGLYAYNHFIISILVHKVDAEKLDMDFEETEFRVVGAEVEPLSVNYPLQDQNSRVEELHGKVCSGYESQPLPVKEGGQVLYTYDVEFLQSEVRWASRWDAYLRQGGGQIHWFSIVNSIFIVFFLSAMVAMIFLRTLHREISEYNELAFLEDASEESGWKLVRGDVFRRPALAQLFAVLLGSGVQITCMAGVVIVLGGVGFLNPAYRGGLVQTMLLLFMLMGSCAGYVSARFYKFFRGADWKAATFLTGTLYPGCVSGLFFGMDMLLWGQRSSGAVGFTTMLAILMLWFGVSVPLVFLGAYCGYRRPPFEVPCAVNALPRDIPAATLLSHPLVAALVGGVLPFGAVFTELFFIMSSLWQHRFYYLFGFLFIVLVVLVVTCVEISIAFTYFQLTSEDYRWWWRSYFCGAGSGFYVFLYAVWYYHTKLHMDKFAGVVLYFGYMAFVSLSFAMMCGSIGSIATFFFVRAIYGAIKCD
jgi:transmembrane 9 superfamily protein 2/4